MTSTPSLTNGALAGLIGTAASTSTRVNAIVAGQSTTTML